MSVLGKAFWIFLAAPHLVITAQTRFDLLALFGNAHSQRFRIDDQVRLTVVYGPESRVCSATIAPPDFNKWVNFPEKYMKSEAVDHIVDILVPGLIENKEPGVMTISGNTSWAQWGRGVVFTRDYLYHDITKTVSANLDAGATCLSQTAQSLEDEYGPPEYEEFSRPPVHIGASYQRSKDLNLTELHVWRLISLGDSSREPTGPGAVEQFVNNFLPETASLGKPCNSTTPPGCVEYHRLVAKRVFDEHEDLVDITVFFLSH